MYILPIKSHHSILCQTTCFLLQHRIISTTQTVGQID